MKVALGFALLAILCSAPAAALDQLQPCTWACE